MSRLIPRLLLFCTLSIISPPTFLTTADAKNLALAAYDREFKKIVGQLWYRHITENRNRLVPGVVQISCRLTEKGRITNVRILSNTSNQLLADISIRTLREAKLPPPSKDALAEAGHNWIEIEKIGFKVDPK